MQAHHTLLPPPEGAEPPARASTAPGAEHWLPRVILNGMLLLALGLLVGMGSYYLYRQEQAFDAQARDIEAQARAQQEGMLQHEVGVLAETLEGHRSAYDARLRARLARQVDQARDIVERMATALGGHLPPQARREAILDALPLNGTGEDGALFVLDETNRALRPPFAGSGRRAPAAHEEHVLERLAAAAGNGNGTPVLFRWPHGGATAEAIALVARAETLGWTIGSATFMAEAQATLRDEALAELARLAGRSHRPALVIDIDGRVLLGPPQAQAATATTWVAAMVRKGRGGGGALDFEMAGENGTPVRHVAWVAPPNAWGWTVASADRADQMDAVIDHQRTRMEQATREDFVVTVLTMLAATAVAMLASLMFYRWIDERFRRFHDDIEARNRALDRKSRELHLSAQVFEASHEAIAIIDLGFRVVAVNPALERISGFGYAELVGRHCAELLTGEAAGGERWRRTAARLRRRPQWAGEITLRRADGTRYPGWVSVGAVSDTGGRKTHFVLSISDISSQKRTEQRLRHLAEYDALTGLPNRVLLLDRMSGAIEAARRHHQHLAVLFIDLDRFKNINDSLGHAVGDGLLRKVAGRLVALVRASDTVSRLGGDEFVVLLTELDTAARAAAVAGKMLKSLAAPYDVDGHELTVTPSIGITVYPEDGDNRDLLLKNADAAMYHAKENGRNSYQFFTGELNERAQMRLALENEMRRALARNEFSLRFQPQFDLRSGRLTGAEALVRWQHPERGLIPPDQFIPIAEETGLIVPLGAWILREACATAQRWRERGLTGISMAVNISAIQVRRGNLESTVFQALGETGFPARQLELEVTESALMTHQAGASATLQAIQSAGVRLAIDDFGTGYSSLAYLKRFKLDTLKIDRSFISDLPDDAEDAHLTHAIVSIGHHLDMKVVAEGVETRAQERFLTELGCDLAQGYLYAMPLAADDFLRLHAAQAAQATSKPASSIA